MTETDRRPRLSLVLVVGLIILGGGLVLVLFGGYWMAAAPELPVASWEEGGLRIRADGPIEPLRNGDLVVAVDGVHLEHFRWRSELGRFIPGGRRHTFVLMRDDRRVVVEGYVPRTHTVPLIAVSLITALSLLAVSLLVLVNQYRVPSVLRFVEANTAIAVSVAILDPYTFETRIAFWFFFYLAPALCFRLLGIVAEDETLRRRLGVIERAVVAWGFLLGGMTLYTLFLYRLQLPLYARYYGVIQMTWSVFTIVHGFVILLLLAASLTLPIRWTRSLRARRRLQWLLWGIVGGTAPYFVGVYVPSYILDLYGSGAQDVALTITLPFILLIPAAATVAIVRYRLFDIEHVIQRSLVYSLTVAILALGAVSAVGVFAEVVAPETRSGAWLYLGAAAAGAILFVPLQRRVQGVVRDWFGGFDYDPLDVVGRFSARVPELETRREAVETVCRIVERVLATAGVVVAEVGDDGRTRIEYASPGSADLAQAAESMAVKEMLSSDRFLAPGKLEANQIEVAARIPTTRGPLMWLLLGPKAGGQAYTDRDQRLIETLCTQLGSTLDLLSDRPGPREGSSTELERYRRRVVELEGQRDRFERLAITDPLTLFFNRRHLETVLEREMNRYRRYEEPFGVLAVDLDGFKEINDRFGHDCGDELLTEVAARITSCLRQIDTPCRVGGDEFVIVLSRVDGDALYDVGGKVCRVVRTTHVRCGGHMVGVTASVGCALVTGRCHRHSVDRLLREADRALYFAKSRDGNATVLYDDLSTTWRLGEPPRSMLR